MHGAFSQIEVQDTSAGWDRSIPAPPPRSADSSEPHMPSAYQAPRIRWPIVAIAVAGHGLLLALLLSLGANQPPRRLQPEPIVVTLVRLPVEPPPQMPPERLEPPADVQTQPPVVAPPPAVQIAATNPRPAIAVPEAPPPPAVVVAPQARPGPVSDADLASKMIAVRPPKYPIESRRKREQGTVVLTVLVGTAGTVVDVSVAKSSGFERLDKAALAAVRAWRWSPMLRDGQPVMVKGYVDIPFVLTG